MRLETDRLVLRTATPGMAPLILDYFIRNAEFLRQWSPPHPESWDTPEIMRMIGQEGRALAARSGFRFHVFRRNGPGIIGSIGLSGIVYGSFLSCFVGYKLDRDEVNKGYMTEALRRVSRFAFSDLGLHRLEANIMPRNIASIRVAIKAGYVCEGISFRYLKIDGTWEDHLHFVLINDAIVDVINDDIVDVIDDAIDETVLLE